MIVKATKDLKLLYLLILLLIVIILIILLQILRINYVANILFASKDTLMNLIKVNIIYMKLILIDLGTKYTNILR